MRNSNEWCLPTGHTTQGSGNSCRLTRCSTHAALLLASTTTSKCIQNVRSGDRCSALPIQYSAVRKLVLSHQTQPRCKLRSKHNKSYRLRNGTRDLMTCTGVSKAHGPDWDQKAGDARVPGADQPRMPGSVPRRALDVTSLRDATAAAATAERTRNAARMVLFNV